LSRALVVRAYLIERGVSNLRLDVRALGNRSDNGVPPDRVDIVMIDH
jgi:outer membrane protein OmpA-like peptidoglycan-associated protein